MKKTARILCAVLACALVLGVSAYAASYSKTLTAYYNDIKLSVNGQTVTPKDVNGKTVDPFIVDGTTYLPVRAVSQALGKQVDWDAKSYTVQITDPGPVGSWKAVRICLRGEDLPLSSFAGGSFAVKLDQGGAGLWTIGGVDYKVTWKEDNGALTILDDGDSPTYGTIGGGIMVLNIEGTMVTLTK